MKRCYHCGKEHTDEGTICKPCMAAIATGDYSRGPQAPEAYKQIVNKSECDAPADSRPRVWWIYSENGYSDHVAWVKPQHNGAWKYIHVIEKSAYDAVCAERDELLCETLIGEEYAKLCVERDQLRRELIEAKERGDRFKAHCKQMDSNLNYCQDQIRAVVGQRDSVLKECRSAFDRILVEVGTSTLTNKIVIETLRKLDSTIDSK